MSFIPLLKYCVQSQTYPREYLEWLVLDDGDLDRSSHFDSDDLLIISNFIRNLILEEKDK